MRTPLSNQMFTSRAISHGPMLFRRLKLSHQGRLTLQQGLNGSTNRPQKLCLRAQCDNLGVTCSTAHTPLLSSSPILSFQVSLLSLWSPWQLEDETLESRTQNLRVNRDQVTSWRWLIHQHLLRRWCFSLMITLSVSFLNSFFFPFIFISWKLITLQYCSGFCHTLTWISHGFTCVPHPDPPLPPPSPSHPSGSSQCTSPEHLSHASNLDWWSVSP